MVVLTIKGGRGTDLELRLRILRFPSFGGSRLAEVYSHIRDLSISEDGSLWPPPVSELSPSLFSPRYGLEARDHVCPTKPSSNAILCLQLRSL